MLHNPIHIKVFGADEQRRLQRLQYFFLALLAYVYKKGQLEGAFDGQRLVGVMGALPPHHCTPTVLDGMRMVPSILRANNPIGWYRIAIWLGTWARLDATEGHWHLGPLAVGRYYRRQGIGSRLCTQSLYKNDGFHFYLDTDMWRTVLLNVSYCF